MARHPEWEFEYGEEIYEGRLALQSIGGGEAFETWLGWDPKLFSIVVLKMVRPHRVDDPKTLRDVEREARALNALAHPIVLRGFGVVLDPPRPHLVLEHLDGLTLRSLIKRSRQMPLEQVLPLAMHICSALHYMHSVGFVHLDVKPRNLIMGPQPRLIDLSVARTFDELERLGGGVGTPAYMAPEQCDPDSFGRIGPPADVWGLAATLYESVTGEKPFGTPSRAEDGRWIYRQMTDPAPANYPRYTPPEVADVITRALAKDQSERPTASEMALTLEPVVANLPSLSVGKRGFRFK